MSQVSIKEEPLDSCNGMVDGLSQQNSPRINSDDSVEIKNETNDSLRSFRLMKIQNFPSSEIATTKKVEYEQSEKSLSVEESINRTIEIVIQKCTHHIEEVQIESLEENVNLYSDSVDLDPAFVCSENPLPVKCIIEENPSFFPNCDYTSEKENDDIYRGINNIYKNVLISAANENVHFDCDESSTEENTEIAAVVSEENIGQDHPVLLEPSTISESNDNCGLNPFQCLDCLKVLSSAGNLRRHVNTKHKGMKPFVCPQCSMNFGEKASLEKHVMAIHDKIRPFRCSECEKACVTKSSLVKHIQSNHDVVPDIKYECSICKGDRTFTRTGFRLHWIKNHDPDPDPGATEDIRNLCRNTRKFKCPICPTRFSSRPAVNTHVLTKHEGARPFSCPLCTANFSSNNHIKRHIDATHKKLRPYDCHICKKQFSYKSFLQRHISHTHMGVKEYECSVCNTCFSEKANMLRHIDMVHKQLKPFVCSLCDAKYCDKAGLKHHLNSKHDIQTP